MSLTLAAVSIAAAEPAVVARFWAGVLGRDVLEHVSQVEVTVPDRSSGLDLVVRRSELPRLGPNRIHLDLTTASQEDLDATVALGLELGGRHIDIGQTAADRHVVLADPEGNELCVIEPENSFLSETDRIGAVNCDGTRAVGSFWSQALGWPLVWDQDEETAIQSPAGGSKVTWSGPPLMPRLGPDRVRLEIATTDGAEARDEVDRLVALGAQRVPESAEDTTGQVLLADPDGNAFRLSASR